MGLGGRVSYRFTWTLIWIVAKVLFRFRIVHKDRLPVDRPFVLAPIHRSYLDTPVGGMVTARPLRFLAKESIWNSRLGGWLVALWGGFPVERGSADRAALRACQEMLERGESIAMFPEGTRQYGPVVEASNMHAGPAFVAARAGVPIVPMGIAGTDRAMPHGARWVRPSKVVIVVGEPIVPPAVEGRVRRRLVDELTEQLRQSIQELFDEAQRLVGRTALPVPDSILYSQEEYKPDG